MDQSKRNQVFEDAKKAVFFKAVDEIVSNAAGEYRDRGTHSESDALRTAFSNCGLQIVELMEAYKTVTREDAPDISSHLRNN